MAAILDKLALLLCGCVLVGLQPITPLSVAALLAGITISALTGGLNRRDASLLLGGGYAVACLCVPSLCAFLPLAFYDVFLLRPRLFGLLVLPPLIAAAEAFPPVYTGMLALSLGLSLLLRQRTRSLTAMRADLLRSRDESREAALRLEEKNRGLMEKQDYEIRLATLGERNRIAREIHDNVGHMLSRSILQVGALMAVNRDETTASGLAGLRDTLTGAMDSIRQSVHDLHDDSIDLPLQLRALTEAFTYCPVTLEYEAEGAMDAETRYAVLAIVKEALSNVARHSGATKVTVAVREHPALYQLIVQDNGRGCAAIAGGGIGLRNIADRAEALGGRFHTDGSEGFRLFVSLPKGRREQLDFPGRKGEEHA